MSKKNEKSLKKNVKRKISTLLSQSPDKTFTAKQVAKAIGFHQPIQKKLVARLLNEMLEDKILEADGERYSIGSFSREAKNPNRLLGHKEGIGY